MGLISRVSSRTYRFSKKMDEPPSDKILVKAEIPIPESPSKNTLPSSPDPKKIQKSAKNLKKILEQEPKILYPAEVKSGLGNYGYVGGLDRCDVSFAGGTIAGNINYAPNTYSKGCDELNNSNLDDEDDIDDWDRLFEHELKGIDPELFDKLNKLYNINGKNLQLRIMESQIQHQIYSAKKRLESAKHAFLLSQTNHTKQPSDEPNNKINNDNNAVPIVKTETK